MKRMLRREPIRQRRCETINQMMKFRKFPIVKGTKKKEYWEGLEALEATLSLVKGGSICAYGVPNSKRYE